MLFKNVFYHQIGSCPSYLEYTLYRSSGYYITLSKKLYFHR